MFSNSKLHVWFNLCSICSHNVVYQVKKLNCQILASAHAQMTVTSALPSLLFQMSLSFPMVHYQFQSKLETQEVCKRTQVSYLRSSQCVYLIQIFFQYILSLLRRCAEYGSSSGFGSKESHGHDNTHGRRDR